MATKATIMIPKPGSRFISVQCTNCGQSRIIFSHSTRDLHCKSCGQMIAKKTGSKANVLGKILDTFD